MSTTQTDPGTKNEQQNPPAGGGTEGGGDERLAHVMKDMHRFKEAAKKAEAELAAIKEAKLKEQNDWKTLYESAQTKAQEAEQREQKIKDSFLGHQKFSAVKEAAAKAGMRDLSDLNLLGLDEVQVETTSTGKINVLGADLFVEKLKASRPHWFGGTGAPKVNTGSPGVGGDQKAVTMDDILKAEKVAKQTGDFSKYEALMKQWQSQKKQK